MSAANRSLVQTWEAVWRTDDVDAAHRDVLTDAASSNTMMFRPYVERALQHYDRPAVLEAGCGLGQWLHYALSRTGGTAIGLDLAEGTLERISKSIALASAVASGRLVVLPGDMRAIPLADRSVDLVFSFGVIEHVRDRDSAVSVREFARVMRPGARLLLSTPNLWCAHTLTRPLARLAGRWKVGFERSISPRRLAHYCRLAGLVVEERGVMESGMLFGETLARAVPALESVSRKVERRQPTLGFMSYVLARKD